MAEGGSQTTVGELKERLDDYGDHLIVYIEKPSGAFANIHDIDDQQINGVPGVVLYSHDL